MGPALQSASRCMHPIQLAAPVPMGGTLLPCQLKFLWLMMMMMMMWLPVPLPTASRCSGCSGKHWQTFVWQILRLPEPPQTISSPSRLHLRSETAASSTGVRCCCFRCLRCLNLPSAWPQHFPASMSASPVTWKDVHRCCHRCMPDSPPGPEVSDDEESSRGGIVLPQFQCPCADSTMEASASPRSCCLA